MRGFVTFGRGLANWLPIKCSSVRFVTNEVKLTDLLLMMSISRDPQLKSTNS